MTSWVSKSQDWTPSTSSAPTAPLGDRDVGEEGDGDVGGLLAHVLIGT